MPRGRHRHEQPLHRLLPPAGVAAAALACAGGAWFVGAAGLGDTDTVVLRGLVALAAAAAVTGAVLTRRWDRRAGRRVSELQARRAGLEWRAEEYQAELEADLEESRELRAALEGKLVAKRAELGRLRSEHAALLRRYANAETERAGALEGRRLLQIEAAEPTRALTSGAADHRKPSGAPTPLTYLQAHEALKSLRYSADRQRRLRAVGPAATATGAAVAVPPQPAAPARLVGGFDFFGSEREASPGAAGPGADPAPGPDGPARPRPSTVRHAAGKVVDLGADEDATGQDTTGREAPAALDISELRGAI